MAETHSGLIPPVTVESPLFVPSRWLGIELDLMCPYHVLVAVS